MQSVNMFVQYQGTTITVDERMSIDEVHETMSRMFPELRNAEPYLDYEDQTIKFRFRQYSTYHHDKLAEHLIHTQMMRAGSIRPSYANKMNSVKESSVIIKGEHAEKRGYKDFVGRRAKVVFALDDLQVAVLKLIDQPERDREVLVHLEDI